MLAFGDQQKEENEENMMAIEFQQAGGTDALADLLGHVNQTFYNFIVGEMN